MQDKYDSIIPPDHTGTKGKFQIVGQFLTIRILHSLILQSDVLYGSNG